MVKGLKARGAFEINIRWKSNQLSNASIKSLAGGKCVIRTAMPVMIKGADARLAKDHRGYLLSIHTVKGKTYQLVAIDK